MRASRLLSILILLQLRKRVSAADLAAEFEVSERTIYRDVDELSAAGVPIFAERGRNGGFALHDGYRTRLTGFTAPEAEALLLATVGDAARDLGMGAHAVAAQLKLLASLPNAQSESAHRTATRFHLDPIAWYGRAEHHAFLPALANAIWTDRQVCFTYQSWSKRGVRRVDPIGLVMKAGIWYLVGRVGAQHRVFRVSGITDFIAQETGFDRADFDLARFWRRWVAAFETRLLSDTAHIKITPLGLQRLREISAAAAEAIDATGGKPGTDGWIPARIPIEKSPFAIRQLLFLGAEIQVLKPAHLRAAMAQEAKAIAALHAGRT